MNSTLIIGTWKEDVCPEEKIDISPESYSEMLEKINFSEKNNNKDVPFSIWCEEYISELPIEPQDMTLVIQNFYEHVM